MSKNRIALVGDVVASRAIKERVTFDDALLACLKELNGENLSILSPYTLIGDEIQAVYGRADSLFRDAVTILATIYPRKMRFSFGVGGLVTPINPKQAIEMDGPAFHLARDGVEALKQSGYLFTLSGEDIPNLHLMRQALFLVSQNMSKWNQVRLQTLAHLQREMPVKDIARKLHISDQAVYKTIDAGGLEVIAELFLDLQAALDSSLEP